MTETKPKKGKLLIAEPSILNDNNFNRSVILITEHNETGTIGFILNKPTIYSLKDLIPKINSNHKVYIGGPVAEDNLYFIHRIPNQIPNSIKIEKNIFWGGDFDTVQNLLNNNLISKGDIRFFLGYSGWSENQLFDELKKTAWLVKENNYKNILNVQPNSFWKLELLDTGGEYQIWANAPSNPKLN
ncbi:MAG: YqgE/AlgH family protein [Flavobacteriaceae bacterium]|nr:YqgE/AlgH family protein [Flavobacteriaceae bacterium]